MTDRDRRRYMPNFRRGSSRSSCRVIHSSSRWRCRISSSYRGSLRCCRCPQRRNFDPSPSQLRRGIFRGTIRKWNSSHCLLRRCCPNSPSRPPHRWFHWRLQLQGLNHLRPLPMNKTKQDKTIHWELDELMERPRKPNSLLQTHRLFFLFPQRGGTGFDWMSGNAFGYCL